MITRKDKAWKRFWSKVKKGPECWEWIGAKTPKGYGVFWMNGKNLYTHRVVWEMGYGTIPQGMHVCHKCDNPPCVRPSHLFSGTNLDNHQDAMLKGRRTKKLTKDQVRRILKDCRTQVEIAVDYNVSQPQISNIKLRKNWGHVT